MRSPSPPLARPLGSDQNFAHRRLVLRSAGTMPPTFLGPRLADSRSWDFSASTIEPIPHNKSSRMLEVLHPISFVSWGDSWLIQRLPWSWAFSFPSPRVNRRRKHRCALGFATCEAGVCAWVRGCRAAAGVSKKASLSACFPVVHPGSGMCRGGLADGGGGSSGEKYLGRSWTGIQIESLFTQSRHHGPWFWSWWRWEAHWGKHPEVCGTW